MTYFMCVFSHLFFNSEVSIFSTNNLPFPFFAASPAHRVPSPSSCVCSPWIPVVLWTNFPFFWNVKNQRQMTNYRIFKGFCLRDFKKTL